MRDLNFFSVYKKRNTKNQGGKIFIIVLAIVVLVFNIMLIGGGYIIFKELEQKIDEKNVFINSEETKTAIRLAEITKSKLGLTNEYLALIQNANISIEQVKILDSSLLTDIQSLIPITTSVLSMSIKDNTVVMDFLSTVNTDPMDLYHIMLNDKRYANIILSSIELDPVEGTAAFSLLFQVVGGE